LPFEPTVVGDAAYWVFLTISLIAAVVAVGALVLWFILAREEEAGNRRRPTATRESSLEPLRPH
jgi:flagellar basal body-associated protein FliL